MVEESPSDWLQLLSVSCFLLLPSSFSQLLTAISGTVLCFPSQDSAYSYLEYSLSRYPLGYSPSISSLFKCHSILRETSPEPVIKIDPPTRLCLPILTSFFFSLYRALYIYSLLSSLTKTMGGCIYFWLYPIPILIFSIDKCLVNLC